MKICIIASMFTPYARGGAETVAYTCASLFTKSGEVVVITAAPWQGIRSLAGAWSIEDGIRVFRFTPFNLFSIFHIAKYPALLRLFWHVLDMFNPHTFLVVRKILRQEKPDLILTHNLKGLGYTIPMAIRYTLHATRYATKWFHTLHDMALLHPTGLRIWLKEESFEQKNPFVSLYRWCTRKLFGSPEVVISPSQFLLNEYRARGFFKKSKTAVVRNPVRREQLQEVTEGYKKLQKVKLFRFLYLGQLEPYKGLRLLLGLWREFSAVHKEAELMIAGGGSMREEVEQAANQLTRVYYAGLVRHDELSSLLGEAHCTVLPSLAYENSPTIVGESFTHGVPVVASRIGGIPELIKEGGDGFLFEPGNVLGLKEAMEKAMNSWAQAREGAQKSARAFSVEAYRDKLEELIGICNF